MIVPLAIIAALDECMTAVDMEKVGELRNRQVSIVRNGGGAHDAWPPITLREKNKAGFYVIDDGNHRVMAAMLNDETHIKATVGGSPFELSWRWPRVAPVLMTRSLMRIALLLSDSQPILDLGT